METGAWRRARGDLAEDAALAYFEENGYRVVERNYRCRHGELDLVVERGPLMCFVEVRMRSRGLWGDPASTITFSKQRKVVRSAQHFLMTRRIRDRALRFDVISVLGTGAEATLEHIPNAFDAGM
jgi:putative endonuclease